MLQGWVAAATDSEGSWELHALPLPELEDWMGLVIGHLRCNMGLQVFPDRLDVVQPPSSQPPPLTQGYGPNEAFGRQTVEVSSRQVKKLTDFGMSGELRIEVVLSHYWIRYCSIVHRLMGILYCAHVVFQLAPHRAVLESLQVARNRNPEPRVHHGPRKFSVVTRHLNRLLGWLLPLISTKVRVRAGGPVMSALNQLEQLYKSYLDERGKRDSESPSPTGGIHEEGVKVTFTPRPASQFATVFPDTASSAELAQTIWWWRFAGEELDPTLLFPCISEQDHFFSVLQMDHFLDAMQDSAFFYEFRARNEGRYQWDFGAPWPNCSIEKRAFLEHKIPSKYPRKFWLSTRPGREWVDLRLNLALGDKTLLAFVKKELVKIRETKGLHHPPPSKGARRRPISWQSLELMDRKRYLGTVFNDSERKIVHSARKRYLENCKALGLDP